MCVYVCSPFPIGRGARGGHNKLSRVRCGWTQARIASVSSTAHIFPNTWPHAQAHHISPPSYYEHIPTPTRRSITPTPMHPLTHTHAPTATATATAIATPTPTPTPTRSGPNVEHTSNLGRGGTDAVPLPCNPSISRPFHPPNPPSPLVTSSKSLIRILFEQTSSCLPFSNLAIPYVGAAALSSGATSRPTQTTSVSSPFGFGLRRQHRQPRPIKITSIVHILFGTCPFKKESEKTCHKPLLGTNCEQCLHSEWLT